jgi:hypothetical protein
VGLAVQSAGEDGVIGDPDDAQPKESRWPSFETVPIGELKHRLQGKPLPPVEEYQVKLEKLGSKTGVSPGT